MLIVCNGAAKSGSTWLYNIVARLREFDWPDRKYLTSSTKHPTIRPNALADFLAREDYTTRDIITKTHYGSPQLRDLLLARPQVRVLDMERGLHDVIVSTYYDSCRREGFDGDFARFYWLDGRNQAEYLMRYHRLWGDGHPQVFVTSFEALKADFAREAYRIADFLGVSINDDDVARLQRETDITSLREQYKDDPQYADTKRPFFRKGEVGDWKNHFDERMLQDIRRIETRGIGRFDPIDLANRVRRTIYAKFPRLSPYRSTDSD